MSTSALALIELLTMVSQQVPRSVTVPKAISTYLQLDDRDDFEAVTTAHKLLARVWSDVNNLPHGKNELDHIKSFLNPFNGLLNFSQFYLTVEQATQNYLTPANINALLNVHLALIAYAPSIDIDNATKGLADQFRSIREELKDADVPVQLKDVLMRRITQIISALEHYSIFGGRELKGEIEALLGKIAVHHTTSTAGAKHVYKRILKASALVLSGVVAANHGIDEFKELVNHGTEILQFVEKLDD